MWTGTGTGYRTLEHRNGCLCRSGHMPAHPFASSQPYWPQEDIKEARGKIVLWGVGGVTEGSAPPPPEQAGPGRPAYASAARSAARGPQPGAVRVVAAAARTSAAHPPVQPTAAALWALLPSTTAVQPLRLYQGECRDKIREWGVAQITPGTHPAEWKQPSQEGALRCVALVGCTVHEVHLAAAAAVVAHDAVQRVTALVHVQGGNKAAPTVATLLQALRRTRASLAVPGTTLQGVVRTERQPWETADPAVVDPAPPGHILQLVWERLPADDDRESAELPDLDPAPLDPVPALSGSCASWTRRAWRMPTYVGSTWDALGRTTRGGTSSRSWGQPCPTPRPCKPRSGVRRSKSPPTSPRPWPRW